MTQSAHTVNTVCLTQHCTNICSQEISVMFKYGWQALQGPQGINHEHLFIPSHLKSFLFSHLLAYSFHKPHSSDFKPIIFSIILLEGCVNVWQHRSLIPQMWRAREIDFTRAPKGCMCLKCVIIKITSSSIKALPLRLGPSHQCKGIFAPGNCGGWLRLVPEGQKMVGGTQCRLIESFVG